MSTTGTMAFVAFTLLLILAPASSLGLHADPVLPHSGTPAGVDPNTDCNIRKFAWEV